ncbi:MAG: hypothetical protein FWG98_02890 [Candidatus Cloacimonetes bacterium]|nr:hypothetical protein [Candidatus Cloacimonadota bacterium]
MPTYDVYISSFYSSEISVSYSNITYTYICNEINVGMGYRYQINSGFRLDINSGIRVGNQSGRVWRSEDDNININVNISYSPSINRWHLERRETTQPMPAPIPIRRTTTSVNQNFGEIIALGNPFDTIVLHNGSRIEAIVLEVSSTEIRYRRVDHLEGPIRVISTAEVNVIVFENGSVEIISNQRQNRGKDVEGTSFGISADPSGFALFGPEAGLEFTKNRLNTQIQVRFPSAGAQNNDLLSGFGIGLNMNYIQRGRYGGFYVGGIGEYTTWKTGDKYIHNGAFAGNVGYRIAGETGLSLSLGASVGGRFGDSGAVFIWRPVTAIGYSF